MIMIMMSLKYYNATAQPLQEVPVILCIIVPNEYEVCPEKQKPQLLLSIRHTRERKQTSLLRSTHSSTMNERTENAYRW